MAEAQTEKSAQAQEGFQVDEFSELLKKEFKPKSDRAAQQVEAAVQTLAKQVLSDQDLILEDAVNSINAIIAEIDLKLTQQVNHILHHESFQKLEGSWRGLHHLVWEVVDNSIDEVINKHASKVEVTLHKDGKSATIRDNRRGIPVDVMKKFKKSALEAKSCLHAGSRSCSSTRRSRRR